MTKDQLKRANSVVFPALILITGYMAFSEGAEREMYTPLSSLFFPFLELQFLFSYSQPVRTKYSALL